MKKGFTLIELLAVIVILAVLALIVAPVISNVIDSVRKSSAIDSAYHYKDAINNAYATSLLVNSNNKLDGKYNINGNSFGEYNLDVSGSLPTNGYMTYENNNLVSACLVINGYEIKYGDNKFYTNGKGNCNDNAIYYTWNLNEGNYIKSDYVYSEADIPNEWKYYIKTTFTDKEYTYVPLKLETDNNISIYHINFCDQKLKVIPQLLKECFQF